jgi:hypothetical protein
MKIKCKSYKKKIEWGDGGKCTLGISFSGSEDKMIKISKKIDSFIEKEDTESGEIGFVR